MIPQAGLERPTRKGLVPYRWELLIWLWLAFFLNQADRQVFGAVLPLLRADLGLSDVQAGLIATVFSAVLGLVVPFAGYAGDVLSRKWIITVSLLVWSASTLLTGFSTGLLSLLAIWSLPMAVSEAFYAPSANSLISEYHVEARAQAMAVHQTSLYTGVVVSGWLAAYIGQRLGWRAAFWLFGGAGIILAVLVASRLRDSGWAARRNRVPPLVVLQTIIRRHTVWLLAIGFAGMVFVNVGYLTWAPTYLHERFGLSLPDAGFSGMFYHHLGASLGVALGSRISDRVAARRPVVRPALQATALLLGSPFLYLIGRGGSLDVVYLAMAGFGVFRGIYDSNIYAALYQVIEPRFHASAASFIGAFAYMAGALSPVALGLAKTHIGLPGGISCLSVVYLAASGFLFIAARFFFNRDYSVVRCQPAREAGQETGSG